MSIYESTKALYREAFHRFEEATREGDRERAAPFRKVLLEVMENTIDDNASLMQEIQELRREQSGVVGGGDAG